MFILILTQIMYLQYVTSLSSPRPFLVQSLKSIVAQQLTLFSSSLDYQTISKLPKNVIIHMLRQSEEKSVISEKMAAIIEEKAQYLKELIEARSQISFLVRICIYTSWSIGFLRLLLKQINNI